MTKKGKAKIIRNIMKKWKRVSITG